MIIFHVRNCLHQMHREPASNMPRLCVDIFEFNQKLKDALKIVPSSSVLLQSLPENWSSLSKEELLSNLISLKFYPPKNYSKEKIITFVNRWINGQFSFA